MGKRGGTEILPGGGGLGMGGNEAKDEAEVIGL